AEEVTARLARLDPNDPVRYDFALCHMGMAGDCPSLADARRCEGCGVKPLCRHWAGRASGPRRAGPARRAALPVLARGA
ncbi:MAG TPA: DUF2400 family protein, partial [Polyangiaceae bacterium]|nr:DUF2400 family protein [Polyangiaceae bacterium]